ncbi:MAG: hypothetical protein JW839_19055 [Candidatus Lokiarchaeota archaeon]|nr:hypothetical protein [Candidatus Lokiarchaeota archaeon]
MAKIAEYVVLQPIGLLMQMTQEFWAGEKIKNTITDFRLAPDASNGTMAIEQSTSFTSWGQSYRMNFYRIDENTTRVEAIVTLVYGGGAQWSKPNTVLKKWAEYVGTAPAKLS